MKRKYFKFPAYFWEAAQSMTAKDKAAFYTAIIDYVFGGVEPALTGDAATCFDLAKSLYLNNATKRQKKR